MVNRRKEPALGKIILFLAVIALAVLGVMRFSNWFTKDFIEGGIEKAAPEAMDTARALLEQGDLAGAREAIEPLISRIDSSDITPQALVLMADIEEAAGNSELVTELIRRAALDYPGFRDNQKLLLRYARRMETEGNADDAYEIYQRMRDTAPPEIRAAAVIAFAKKAETEGDLKGARDLLQQAAKDAKWGSEEWDDALDGLSRLNVHSLFSIAETPEAKYHTIAKGDNLTSIGVKYNVTLGQLMRANNITDPSRLRLNQRIKYTPKDFRIVIERSKCRLFLLDSNGIFARYSVGLGRAGHETVIGRYKIGHKQKDPMWYRPNGSPVASGAPDNELGTRWMPLVPDEEGLPADLGIHGTIQPDSIGKYESSGCPRMHRKDVEVLYDLVVRSTPVEIVKVFEPNMGS